MKVKGLLEIDPQAWADLSAWAWARIYNLLSIISISFIKFIISLNL